jgi:N-methylhydantoinase B
MQSMEVIYQAVSKAMPTAVPACSGGDICALVWWGEREDTGEPWADGSPHPVGQGASVHGDGAHSLLHHAEAATRFSPTEVWEQKNPWLLEKVELAPDSGGAGKHRGGLGVDFWFTAREDMYVTAAVERTKTAPWGLEGGLEARPNGAAIRLSDGTRRYFGKATRLLVPKGATIELYNGGGGGYGDPGEREREAVHQDIAEGYFTEEYSRKHYPHAFD